MAATTTDDATEAIPAEPAAPDAAAAAARPPLEDARPLLLQALALIVATTLVFWVVGLFRDGSGDPVAGADATTDTDAGEATGDAAVDGDPAADDAVNGIGTGDPATDDAEAPAADDEGTAPAAEDEADAPAADEPAATPAGGIAPATISIQVLDAVLDDGGAAANRIAAEMRAAGYDVVVVNAASVVYDETTVFYSTQSAVPAADQVSDVFGFPRVGLKPDNLSPSVQLHVVVGTDQR